MLFAVAFALDNSGFCQQKSVAVVVVAAVAVAVVAGCWLLLLMIVQKMFKETGLI